MTGKTEKPFDAEQFAGHTPGPWHVSAGIASNLRLIVEDDLGLAVCAVSLRGVQGNQQKMAANARLIAAAPDLLAKVDQQSAEIARLREALREIAHQSPSSELAREGLEGDFEEGYDAIICIAREALSAQPGEQS